jgi:hypothetical protein
VHLAEGSKPIDPDLFNPMVAKDRGDSTPQFSLAGAADRCGLETVTVKAADVKVVDA